MINEQKARFMWSDYMMQVRVTAVLKGQQVDAESSLMRLSNKNRKNALNSYLQTLIG